GGIYCQDSNPTISKLIIDNNFATINGGGFYCKSSSPIIKKITVAKNSVDLSGLGGGFYFTENSSASLSNSIIAFNTGEGIYPATSDCYINLRYSDIHGNTPENFGGNSNPSWGEYVSTNANGDSCDVFYNLIDDPHFSNLSGNDFHLLWESPCIDAGDPLSPPDPDGTIADMGFYSFDQNVVVADFSGTPQIGIAPLTVDFSDLSCPGTGNIISWEWNFGDGTDTTYSAPIPLTTHTYQDTGNYIVKDYDVSLTIISATTSGNVSDTKTKENYIKVYEPVNALFQADSTAGIVPFTTQFNNLTTGAYDSLFWDLGDSTYLSTMDNSFSHTYEDTGSYTVKLFASGNGGTDSLVIENYINVFGEIIVDFTADATFGIAPFTAHFLNFSTGVYDTLHWYFGDGEEVITTEDTVSHTYQDSGYYDVTLAISNDAVTDSLTKENYIQVFSPVVAMFHVDDSTLISGNEAIFTNESSGDISIWHWIFGDGSDTTMTTPVDTIRHIYNVYNVSDTFTVKLIVSGMGGLDTLRRMDLMSIYGKTDADFDTDMNSSIVPFWIHFTDNSTGDYNTWNWDFGDGNTLVNSAGQAGSDSVDASLTDSLTVGTYQNPIHKYDSLAVGVLDVSLIISGNGGADSLTKMNNIFAYPKSNLIWPGDTDYNGVVEAADIYNIGSYWQDQGTPRNEISFAWIGNNYSENWEEPMASLADCNGDSLVNVTDVLAMCLHMGKTHPVADTEFTYLQPPRNYEDHRNNFIEIYHTLGTTRNEILIRNHIAAIFGLPAIEIIENNFVRQNFPNPIKNITEIQFGLKNDISSGSIKIFNVKGQLVKTYNIQNLAPGIHTFCWDGTTNNHTPASNGIYFYMVDADKWKSKAKKMILMK
ncbi:MAG: PKD domain-containing protein, partial [Candidatus Cloacimonadota bacterium]|nr:PKD domain-containing protein [Candidatus Cloacimonadota bacterium]